MSLKIRIIAMGKLKKSPHLDLCQEYLKRMKWHVTVQEIDSPKSASAETEASLIHKTLPDDGFIVAMDERGKSYGSVDFANQLTEWHDIHGQEIIFLIGGADGFDQTIRDRAKILMSFGKQTFPHMLVRVMLLEQIYRAQQIIAGHPYHRE